MGRAEPDGRTAGSLPDPLSVEAVRFELDDGALVLTDGGDLSMNLSDAPHGGKI